MKDKLNIVFCAAEVVPFAKTGGMADVCGALPLALEDLGATVTIFMPRYKNISKEKYDLTKLNNVVSATQIGKAIQVYFIENEKFYHRDGIYGDSSGDYADNLKRFQFYCFKTLEALKQLNIPTDIIHCHDWHAALIPVYLKHLFSDDPFFKDVKTVFSIHNLAYQGLFPKDEFLSIGLDKKLYNRAGFEYYDQINLLKAGILNSDIVSTVSPTYADEIKTPEFGCGLDGVLNSRKGNVQGILNGIDYSIWNPEKDTLIACKYSSEQADKKEKNKKQLQKDVGLPEKEDIPVFGMVGRLSHQKGLDLIIESIDAIADIDMQMVILGLGEKKYLHSLKKIAKRYPERIAVHFTFNEKLAHQIYAGSDAFLMPSVHEPCGLSQMISLKYGTIPLVFKTGGLSDTIQSFEEGGNGFVFSKYTKEFFVETIKKAIETYNADGKFSALIQKAFKCNFSWKKSARRYVDLYNECLK